MAKSKKNLKKCIALSATIGTILAGVAALVARLHLKKKYITEERATEADDFDTIDLASINNDTPRDYVSIKINNNKE